MNAPLRRVAISVLVLFTMLIINVNYIQVVRSDELRNALTDELVPAERRQAIVEDLLGSRASPTTVSLVSLVVGSGRGRDLPAGRAAA